MKTIPSRPEVSFRLSPELLANLDAAAESLDANRSQCIRRAIRELIAGIQLTVKSPQSIPQETSAKLTPAKLPPQVPPKPQQQQTPYGTAIEDQWTRLTRQQEANLAAARRYDAKNR
jgi:Ribbon-helix-helix protein, copG family